MDDDANCLKCGGPLTPDAREGVCPKCLLGQALADDLRFPRPPFRLEPSLLDRLLPPQTVSGYLDQIRLWRLAVLCECGKTALHVAAGKIFDQSQEAS